MSDVSQTWVQAVWTASKILFAGAMTTVLAVCLGIVCGILLPVIGGALGVAFAGAVFCYFWGWIVLGRERATRCRIVGLLSLLVSAGLVVATMAIGAKPLGDQIAFRLAFGIAGMTVGAALGCVVPDRRHVGQSAAAGLVAWLIAGVIAVPTFGVGPDVGPLMFFALLYTPGIGLTLWGIVMGVMLAPRRSTLDDN